MSALDRLDDLAVRLYLAAVIGPSRAPFGIRGQASLATGSVIEIARNSTDDRVIFVTVSRADLTNLTVANVIFSQNSGPSANDYSFSFTPTATERRFVLKPGDSLSMLVTAFPSAIPAQFVFAQETF